jgi:hypothetical protein
MPGGSVAEFLDALTPLGGALSGGSLAGKRAAYRGAQIDGRLLADSVGQAMFAGCGMIDVG